LKGLLHLGAKPMFHTIGDEAHGHQKEKDGWNEGKADKSHHQFSSEPGSQHLPFSFKDQFHKIPDHQKDQEQNQDDVDVDQAEDDDIVGNRDFSLDLGKLHLDGCEDDNEDGDDPNDDQLISSSSCIRGKRFLHRYPVSLMILFNPLRPPLARESEGEFFMA
jgi:hypothetical protein